MAGILLLAGPGTNRNRLVFNVPAGTGYANFVKGWSPTNSNQRIPPTSLDADGYPNTTLGTSYSSGITLRPSYYDKYVWKWSGTGSMQFISEGAIVYSGGAAVTGLTAGGGPAGTGYVTTNFTVAGTAPNVQFKFAALVASVSGGNGSLVTITIAAAASSVVTTGRSIKFNQGCSDNLVNGPNADGSWTITNVNTTSFTLNNSTGVISPSVTGSGGVGTQTEAIVARSAPSLAYNTGVAFSSFTSLVVCTEANEADVDAGLVWDSAFVDSLKLALGNTARGNPGWLRFMDVSGVQGSYDGDFAARIPATSASYSTTRFAPGWWAGTITNGGADDYTCSDPSITVSDGGGGYLDNAIVQGVMSATNTTGAPTLAVGGGPAKPIIDTFDYGPAAFRFSAPPTTPGTDVLQFTFSATWLNGGTPYVFTYNTVAGDTTVTALNGRIQTALAADSTLTGAKIYSTNSGRIVIRPPTAQLGRLTITYSSGPAICTINTMAASVLGTSQRSFVYSYLLDAWIWRSTYGGMLQCIPYEAVAELCNRVNAHCWISWPVNTKSANITAVSNFFATNLNSNLYLGCEYANEPWNSGQAPYGQIMHHGYALSLANNENANILSYAGLRGLQFNEIARTAWVSAGRSASTFYSLQMGQAVGPGIGSTFDLRQMNGTALVTTNTTYSTYGGVNGGSAPDYSTAGSRPGDYADGVGIAPYIGSPWFGPSASSVSGTVSENAPWLQASLDYQNGSAFAAFTSLYNQFNGVTARPGGTRQTTLPNYNATYFPAQEAQVAQFDSQRASAGKAPAMIIHYEAGPEWAPGSDSVNGINTPSSLSADIATFAASDITALANRMTALSWDVSAYTVSGTNDKTEMATQAIQMAQGWKYDTDKNGNAVGSNTYKNLFKLYYYDTLVATHSGREVHPAQYTYSGAQWGMFWSSWDQVAPAYQNFYAASEFSA